MMSTPRRTSSAAASGICAALCAKAYSMMKCWPSTSPSSSRASFSRVDRSFRSYDCVVTRGAVLRWVWDEEKNRTNRRDHKVSFEIAERVFDDPLVLIEQDLAEDYGEDRFLATGLIEGLLITVAYTERDDRVRIISARKASTDEQRAYDQG